jgi:putative peptidoglycan lipid II flippase
MKINRLQKLSTLWQTIAARSVNARIFSAAIVVAGGTLFVKVLAVVKELVVAWKFGTADELDAFLIALIIPSVFIAIVAGSFNSALIPTYIKVREQEGKIAAQKLFCGATVWSIGLLLIVTVMLVATAPLYLSYMTGGFSAKKLDLTYQLLWLTSPMIILNGINVVWGAVLNAGERFALVALAPIATPAITILFLFAIDSFGVFNLGLGMVFGQLIEMVIIGLALRKQNISLIPRWYGFDDNLKEVAGQYAPMIAGAFLMCSTGLIDQSMAAMLPSGSVSSLSYGSRIISLPITIATTGLSTAVIPYFSKMVALDDWNGVRKSLKYYMGLIFAFSLPLTVAIILFSEPIVHALLQRGSFTAENTRTVADIQSCLAIQIPFYIASVFAVRINSAMRNNKIMMWGSAGNLIVNIGLNYIFMQWWGVAGIALSTSFVYIFSFAFLLFFALRNLKSIDNLGLTAEQKEKIEQLRQAKFDRINTVLTPQQRQALQEIEEQKHSKHHRRNGIDLSADQKTELLAIRQENMQRFRSLLTPVQDIELQKIGGLEKGISTLFQRGFSQGRAAKLNLNSAQKSKIVKLLQEDRQQMNAVLTPEQQQKAIVLQSHRKAIKTGWKSLNLTTEQKAEMRAIRQSKKQQLNTILTSEQQSKIKHGKGRYKI